MGSFGSPATSYHVNDTIVAVASPPGGAARGIVRLSGPGVTACVERLFKPHSPASLVAFKSIPGNLRLPGLHSPMPADLYLWPNGRSYTGQPVAEFHTLGSPPLLEVVLRAACEAGARLAQPGEFTLRAFLAGRIDLTQAEAVLGVIEANDDAHLQTALEQLAGGLSRPLMELRESLLDLLSHLEAGFDFPDEDVSFITPEQLAGRLGECGRGVARLAVQLQSRRRTDDRLRAVLVGPPNAGKSSLFNALVGRPGAIVSHHPGTTRDYLSAEIDLDGIRLELIDTAGMGLDPENETSGGEASLDQVAERISRTQSERADVRIYCVDIAPLTNPNRDREGAVNHFGQITGCLGQSAAVAQTVTSSDILVVTKADLMEVPSDHSLLGLPVSAVTGQGLDALRAELRSAALAAQSAPDHAVASTAARCSQSLEEAAHAIESAKRLAAADQGEELIAAELRAALDAVGRVAGTVHTDDVLDRVFSRFCIGK